MNGLDQFRQNRSQYEKSRKLQKVLQDAMTVLVVLFVVISMTAIQFPAGKLLALLILHALLMLEVLMTGLQMSRCKHILASTLATAEGKAEQLRPFSAWNGTVRSSCEFALLIVVLQITNWFFELSMIQLIGVYLLTGLVVGVLGLARTKLYFRKSARLEDEILG